MREITLQQATLIACVDDDPTVLQAMEDLLDASGFHVDGFSSAEDFLNRGQLKATSCLITDVQLGGMSGLQLQERLAASGIGIPTIVISAFVTEQVRLQALRSGAVCVLSKPVSKDDLLNCIRGALERGEVKD
jgi:FixJ family two-component response regulator